MACDAGSVCIAPGGVTRELLEERFHDIRSPGHLKADVAALCRSITAFAAACSAVHDDVLTADEHGVRLIERP